MLRWSVVTPILKAETTDVCCVKNKFCKGCVAQNTSGRTGPRGKPIVTEACGFTKLRHTLACPWIDWLVEVVVGVVKVQDAGTVWTRRLHLLETGTDDDCAKLVADCARKEVRKKAAVGESKQVYTAAVHVGHGNQGLYNSEVGRVLRVAGRRWPRLLCALRFTWIRGDTHEKVVDVGTFGESRTVASDAVQHDE